MIFSKANLTVVEMTKVDNAIPALDNVHLKVDGTTIGSNGMTVMAVSPVHEKIIDSVPLESNKMFANETVAAETIKEVLKNMPRDTMFRGVLEHCDFANGKFNLTDGKRRREIVGKTYPREYVNYKAVFERAGESKVQTRVAVNLRRLLDLLATFNKVCPDTAKNQAIFLEFTDANDVVVRAKNAVTKQRAIAVLKAYSGAEGAWMERNDWEKELFTKANPVECKKINKKKRK